MSLSRIRAICFDLDNTLWDVWPVIMRAERAMYDFLAERYPKTVANLTVEALREVRDAVAHEFPQMQHDFTFLRKQSLRKLAEMHAYPDCLVEEAFDVFIRARNEVTLYDEVLPALETLRERFRLFTASNGNADLQKIGIGHLFERSVAARDVGAAKPDPRIFQKAIEGTGLTPDEVIYVGDDPLIDVIGARRAGMHPVWINRNGTVWPEDIEPPVEAIASLDDLVALTRRI
ncbi:MAG TPA: HAD family hydrolase [Steroidobacteraceae bacterium]